MNAMDTPVRWRSLVLFSAAILGWASYAVWGQNEPTPDPPGVAEMYITPYTTEWTDEYVAYNSRCVEVLSPVATSQYTCPDGAWMAFLNDVLCCVKSDHAQLGLRSDGTVVWREHEEER